MTTLARAPRCYGPIIATLISLSSVASGQAIDPPSEAHRIESGSDALPMQAGQAAFAAVQEVVALLQADSDTDWSKVRVDVLREHLLDMDELFMRAESGITVIGDEVRILVTGKGRTLSAAQRMIPAHAAMMNGYREWRSTAIQTPSGVLWKIAAATAAERARIQGLGLFGLLTLGAHHGPHHLAIARGEQPHLHR